MSLVLHIYAESLFRLVVVKICVFPDFALHRSSAFSSSWPECSCEAPCRFKRLAGGAGSAAPCAQADNLRPELRWHPHWLLVPYPERPRCARSPPPATGTICTGSTQLAGPDHCVRVRQLDRGGQRALVGAHDPLHAPHHLRPLWVWVTVCYLVVDLISPARASHRVLVGVQMPWRWAELAQPLCQAAVGLFWGLVAAQNGPCSCFETFTVALCI